MNIIKHMNMQKQNKGMRAYEDYEAFGGVGRACLHKNEAPVVISAHYGKDQCTENIRVHPCHHEPQFRSNTP